MPDVDLSVLIPARNEMWLKRTVEDVLKHAHARTEIIVIADGQWPVEPLTNHPMVHLVYHPEAVGQRAATNEAARLARGTYVMKLDAHCSVDDGFDRKLMAHAEALGRETTIIPTMFNLHVFNWLCRQCGHETYQGPTLEMCEKCKKPGPFERKVYWKKRDHKRTHYWRFDHTLHFQYWGEFDARPEAKADVVDVPTSIGACFFMARDRFFQLGGLDEKHGSWGQYGVEIACKSWLSGGRHVVVKDTWFAHLFRTQGKDFSFPYPQSEKQVQGARSRSRDIWMNNKWEGQVRPLSWLLQKFAPLPGWHDPDGAAALAQVAQAGATFRPRLGSAPETPEAPLVRTAKRPAGIVYYSDNRGEDVMLRAVRKNLATIAHAKGLPIAAVTLDPVDFGTNRVLPYERGYLTMFRQILAGLEMLDTDIAFLCEHDVLYAPEHFDFVPPKPDVFYYNQAVWKVDAATGRALFYKVNQTSGLCAARALLIAHYRARIARVEAEGFNRKMGFEPGTRKIKHGGIDDCRHDVWVAARPNLDIRHADNLTASRWSKADFRNQRYTEGWTESDRVPGWGATKGRVHALLAAAGDGAAAMVGVD